MILKTLNLGTGKVSPWLHVVKANYKRKPDNAKDRVCKHMKKHLFWNSLKCLFRRSVQTASAKTTPEWGKNILGQTKGPWGKKPQPKLPASFI